MLSSEIESWTHPENAEVCPEPRRDDSCVVLMPDDWRTIAAHSGGLLHRVFGLRIERPAAQIADWCSRGSRSLSWKIPLRAIGEDQTRTLIIYDTAQQEVVGVQGTEWSRRSQSRIEVKRPPSGADAFVIIRTPPTGKFEAGIPPLPFELRDGEDAVLRDVPLP
jgi:hypothetical protein